jgi:hypothetical protein
MFRRSIVLTGLFATASALIGASPLRAQYDRYGVHKATAPVHAPDCSAATETACFADSTRHYSSACCATMSGSEWLVTGRAGDSVEFFAQSPIRPALLSLDFAGRPFHSWQEHDFRGTASFVRVRLPSSGWYRLAVDLDLDDTVIVNDTIGLPYELRIHRIGSEASPYSAPLLQILSPTKKPISVRLRWLTPGVPNADPVTVRSGTYRLVARPGDQMEVCRIPCRQPQLLSFDTARVVRVRP